MCVTCDTSPSFGVVAVSIAYTLEQTEDTISDILIITKCRWYDFLLKVLSLNVM